MRVCGALRTVRIRGTESNVVPDSNWEFWQSVASGTWEPETTYVFERYLDPAHSYIDIGSWIGPTLLYGCQIARRAYGIEPDPLAFAELRQNVEANRFAADKVELFNVCIAQATGRFAFGNRGGGGDSMSSLLFASGKTRWTVEGLSFRDFLERADPRDCGFIKMDIEGGEYEVLPTMAGYLEQNRPTVYLSLHPCFLGRSGGLLSLWKGVAERLKKTAAVLRTLSGYADLYDPYGHTFRPRAGTLKSRIDHCLAASHFRLLVKARVYLYALLARPSAIVATDVH